MSGGCHCRRPGLAYINQGKGWSATTPGELGGGGVGDDVTAEVRISETLQFSSKCLSWEVFQLQFYQDLGKHEDY